MDGPLQENCHTYLLLSVEEQMYNTYRVDSSADLKVQILKRGSGNRDASQDFAKSELLKLLLTKV